MDKNDIEVYNRNDPLTWMRPQDDELDIVDIWGGVLRNKKIILVIWISISLLSLTLAILIEHNRPVYYSRTIFLKTAHYISSMKEISAVPIKHLKKSMEDIYLPQILDEINTGNEKQNLQGSGLFKLDLVEAPPTILKLTFLFRNKSPETHEEFFQTLLDKISTAQKPAIKNLKLQFQSDLASIERDIVRKKSELYELSRDRKINPSDKKKSSELLNKEIELTQQLLETKRLLTSTIKGASYTAISFDPKNKFIEPHNKYIPLALGIVLGLVVALLTALIIELNKAVARRAK